MSKLVITAVGGDIEETLSLRPETQTEPGPEAEVVEVEATPINGADSLFVAGWFGVYPQVPADMGAEGVERVVEVGSQVDQILAGRRVGHPAELPLRYLGDQDRGSGGKRDPGPGRRGRAQLARLAVNPGAAYSLLHDYLTLEPGDWVA